MKKLIKITISSVCIISLITGCASGKGKVTASGLQKVTLSTWAGGTELSEFNEIVKNLNETKGVEKGYQLELMSVPAEYYTKMQSAFASKSSEIDLMWLGQEYTSTYAELGGLQDITTLVNEDTTIDINEMYDAGKKASSYENLTYGIPWIINPGIVYYNKTITSEAGYTQEDYDKWSTGDWDTNEFAEIALSMSKDLNGDGTNDQYGTYVWDWPPFPQWLWAFGGGYLDDDNNVTINSPQSVEAWEYMVNLMITGASALPASGSSNNGMTSFFQSGKVGMVIAGASDGIEEDGLPFEIGYAVVPKGPTGLHATFPWIGVTALSVFSDVEQELLYTVASDISSEIFKWKITSPIKGQELLYQDLSPRKALLPADVLIKSLEIAETGNLNKDAEIRGVVLGGTDGLNGIQSQIQVATTQRDYVKALSELNIQEAADITAEAIEAILAR